MVICVEKLTALQNTFVAEYITDFKGTDAAIRAGYSPRSAHVTATKMLNQAKIQEAIAKACHQRQRRLQVTQDGVVTELAYLGFSRLTDYVSFGTNGLTLKSSDELTDAQVAAIQEVTERTNVDGSKVVKIKLYDKVKALEQLRQHTSKEPALPPGAGGDLNINVQVINQVNNLDLSRLSIEELEAIEQASTIIEQRAWRDIPGITAGPGAGGAQGEDGEVAQELPALCPGSGSD